MAGSAELDLCLTAYTVLNPEIGMLALLTGVYDPLLSGTVGLLLVRTSTTMQGIFVAPGMMNADFEGEIKVMTH